VSVITCQVSNENGKNKQYLEIKDGICYGVDTQVNALAFVVFKFMKQFVEFEKILYLYARLPTTRVPFPRLCHPDERTFFGANPCRNTTTFGSLCASTRRYQPLWALQPLDPKRHELSVSGATFHISRWFGAHSFQYPRSCDPKFCVERQASIDSQPQYLYIL
jgi:hypothetical protein